MNAGQMFMSMIQGVIQPVTPDIPLTALPLAGELRKSSADFAALLSEIRTQSNAKAVSADGIVGAIVQPIGSELQEEFSVSDNSTEVWELSGVETDQNQESSGIQDELGKPESAELDAPRENAIPGGIPENLTMYAAGTQEILAAYAQSGRMPAANSPSSHEVDKVQNVTLNVKQGKQLFTAETTLTTRFAEQAYRSLTAESEQRLALQTALPDTAQMTQSTPQLNVETETNAFVPIQSETGSAVKVTIESKSITTVNGPPPEVSAQKAKASQQQPGRMPLINIPTGHKVDNAQNVPIAAEPGQQFSASQAPVMDSLAEQPQHSPSQPAVKQNAGSVTPDRKSVPVETSPISTSDKPVLQRADNSFHFTNADSQLQLPPQTNVFSSTPQISAKTATVKFEQTQTSAAPVIEAAANPETTQNSERISSVNSIRLESPLPILTVPQQQPEGMLAVNFSTSHPVNSTQNRTATSVASELPHVETVQVPTTDKPLLQTAEQTFRFVTADPEQQLPQQTKISAATTQAISINAAPEFVQTQTAAALAIEVAVKPEAIQQTELTPSVKIVHSEAPVQNSTAPQQPGRMPVINYPPSQEVDFTQKTITIPVAAELSLVVPTAQIAVQPLSRQEAISKTVAPELMQTQNAEAPVIEVAPKPDANLQAERFPSVNRNHLEAPVQDLTVLQQHPGRIPVVNSPPSHEVDSSQKAVAAAIATKLPNSLPATHFEAQPLSEQEVRPVAVHQQSSRVETAPISSKDMPAINKADHTEMLSTVSPEPLLSRSATPALSESEAEIAFSMLKPIVVSKAHSTVSSRMLQTAAIMRPQIISLDNDQHQNYSAEFGTVSAAMPETSSVAAAQRHENGRKPEAIFTPSPEIGLTQKVRPEVVITNTETSVKLSEEANQLKATTDINSAPMQQAISRMTVQVGPNANSEIATSKPDSNQAVAKENTVFQQNAVPAGEAPLSSDDSMSNNGEQDWSSQRFDNQMATNQIHAQSKTEPQTAGTVPNVRNNAEQVRQDLPEQIAHQVRERLTQHEVKPGNQQISLTLSPENMGELKMNLNLQGQRLSVEIVTESRTARDAIMQHSDSLKESLARQNITVESFDVTSNGRGSGNPGHNNQDAWKELARQKQQQLWTTSGGYRLPQMETSPNTLAYQARNEHGMLDIHY